MLIFDKKKYFNYSKSTLVLPKLSIFPPHFVEILNGKLDVDYAVYCGTVIPCSLFHIVTNKVAHFNDSEMVTSIPNGFFFPLTSFSSSALLLGA